ncbi:MAG: transposase [Nitrospirae bacterium]|nr:transposase [Nitrospirota bacterium]
MPRTARIAPKEYVYHILTRGNNRQDVFKKVQDYKKYIEILQRYKEKYKFKLYHYVLMSNHVHLVMEPAEKGGTLAEIMKGINLSYAQYYKVCYKHIGHFWQDRYKSIIIAKDNYLLACGSYVELNPVRARKAEDPQDYKWSSYNAYAHGKKDVLLDKHPIYKGLSKNESERRMQYREFIRGMVKEKNMMKGEMNRRVIYGSEDFTDKVTKEYNVNAMVKPKGRPKKDKNEDK